MLIFGQLKVNEVNEISERLIQKAQDAQAESVEKQKEVATAEDTKKDREAAEQAQETAKSIIPIGYVVLGVGVAVVATGVILHVLFPPKKKHKKIKPTHITPSILLHTSM